MTYFSGYLADSFLKLRGKVRLISPDHVIIMTEEKLVNFDYCLLTGWNHFKLVWLIILTIGY